jgi:hypothetical protein
MESVIENPAGLEARLTALHARLTRLTSQTPAPQKHRLIACSQHPPRPFQEPGQGVGGLWPPPRSGGGVQCQPVGLDRHLAAVSRPPGDAGEVRRASIDDKPHLADSNRYITSSGCRHELWWQRRPLHTPIAKYIRPSAPVATQRTRRSTTAARAHVNKACPATVRVRVV